MHCLVELHSQLISPALMIWYILIPWFTYFGTSYRPLASTISQLSILCCLIKDGILGLDRDAGHLSVFQRALWCVSPWCVTAGASRLVTGERLPREDAIWPLTRAACHMGWNWRVLALNDRSSVDLASDDFYRTNRPPCIGRRCGVRLVVDSTPPISGSRWSCRETGLSSLEDFASARPGNGSCYHQKLVQERDWLVGWVW
jgi:hypothetical protein